MSFDDLIASALSMPPSAIPYHLSRELTSRLPERSVLETDWYLFDVDELARGGLCSARLGSRSHGEVNWYYEQSPEQQGGQGLSELRSGWLLVEWQGKQLEVLRVCWQGATCAEHRYWVLADDEATARGFFEAVCQYNAEVRDEILVFEGGSWSKSEPLRRAIAGTGFDSLVLAGSLADDIRKDLERFFASRELYARHRIPWKRGILLVGPPGNGKTHAIKALVNALRRPCLYVKSFESEHDTPSDNVRNVFAQARTTAPCLLVLEDLDSLLTDENRSFFLNELDGFASNEGIVTIASTNHPDRLDPAIVDRPSRFDRKYPFLLPGEAERLAYLSAWNHRLEPDVRASAEALRSLASETEGFSFAYLKELGLSSLMRWANDPRPGGMDGELRACLEALRSQMATIDEATG